MGVDFDTVYLPDKLRYKFSPRPKFMLVTKPSTSGHGYLAGSYPDGITTVEGEPKAATVRAVVRSPNPAVDGSIAGEVVSSHDGTWQIKDLNENLKYDVVGRKYGFNDVVMTNIISITQPRITSPYTAAYIGRPFEFNVLLAGGTPPYEVLLVSGVPPSGIVFADGVFSGQWPTGETGSYHIDLSITDAEGRNVAEKIIIELVYLPLKLLVEGQPPELALLNSPVLATVFKGYRGEAPYTYACIGELPLGMSFDVETGILEGTPTEAGEYEYSISVTDTRGVTVARNFTTTIQAPVVLAGVNHALGKAVTSSTTITPVNGSSSPVNGNIVTANYTSFGSGLQWLAVDLAGFFSIDTISAWFYWQDGRRYYGKKIQHSIDGVDWVTVYDDTVDPVQSETASGNVVTFTAIYARYIRVFASGNTANTSNHIVELQTSLSE